MIHQLFQNTVTEPILQQCFQKLLHTSTLITWLTLKWGQSLICKTSNDGNVLPVLEFRMALNMNGGLIATLPMDFTLTSLNMRPEIYFLLFIAIWSHENTNCSWCNILFKNSNFCMLLFSHFILAGGNCYGLWKK